MLGTTSIIKPITYSISFNFTIILLIFITILVLLFDKIGEKNSISKVEGVAMILLYLEYILLII